MNVRPQERCKDLLNSVKLKLVSDRVRSLPCTHMKLTRLLYILYPNPKYTVKHRGDGWKGERASTRQGLGQRDRSFITRDCPLESSHLS